MLFTLQIMGDSWNEEDDFPSNSSRKKNAEVAARGKIPIDYNERLAFLKDALLESFRNIRHYQELAYKAATLGATAYIGVFAWFTNLRSPLSTEGRCGLEISLVVMTLTFLSIIDRCERLVAHGQKIVSEINTLFGCFEQNFYFSGRTLLPLKWQVMGSEQRGGASLLLKAPIVALFLLITAIVTTR